MPAGSGCVALVVDVAERLLNPPSRRRVLPLDEAAAASTPLVWKEPAAIAAVEAEARQFGGAAAPCSPTC